MQQEWQQIKEVTRAPSRKALAGKLAAATLQINKLLARQSMEVPPSIDVLAILGLAKLQLRGVSQTRPSVRQNDASVSGDGEVLGRSA